MMELIGTGLFGVVFDGFLKVCDSVDERGKGAGNIRWE